MVHRISAVVGANYGDEGKGRTVDWLTRAAAELPTVIRHNSGGQAGHTVVAGDKKHVFSHVGSGTLSGAQTLLCHKFVVNPIIFNAERRRLADVGVTPIVYVSYDCLVSTPLDALVNQLVEQARGARRHGSCGVGFGETWERLARAPDTSVRVVDLTFGDEDGLLVKLDKIARHVALELQLRGLHDTPCEEKLGLVRARVLDGSFNWHPWIKEITLFTKSVFMLPRTGVRGLVHDSNELIFEGAQGLLLHQGHENFPHVTRSRTGLEDVVEFMGAMSILDVPLDPYYCTRPYLTRHGNGPMEDECPTSWFEEHEFKIADETNVENVHQGVLRFGRLNVETLIDRVYYDVERTGFGLLSQPPHPTLVINCLDQAPQVLGDTLVTRLNSAFKLPVVAGYGPDSADTEITESRRTTMGAPAPETVIEPTDEAVVETSTETLVEPTTEAAPEA